ncbi:MAG: hypothetical protein Q9209_006202, partial [Squamulea sp. 1 TL-2023]
LEGAAQGTPDEVETQHTLEEQSHEGVETQPTQEAQLAAVVVEEEEVGSDGEECELHVYESKYDTRGEHVVLKTGTKSEIKSPKRRSHRAYLVLTHYNNRQAKVNYTELEVQSRHVIRVLRKTIGTYVGVDFSAEALSIPEPPRCLFHYQDELRRHAEESDNEQEKSHIRLCLQYMEKTLHREMKISKSSDLRGLEYRDLWIVFKPGCLIFHKDQHGDEHVVRLRSIDEDEDEDHGTTICTLQEEFFQYHGKYVGPKCRNTRIKRYTGWKPIGELQMIPLCLHPEGARIRCDLLQQGRKYLSLGGIHHCCYDGRTRLDDMLARDLERTNVRGNPSQFGQPLLLTSYSLELKQWDVFSVTKITEVAYNNEAFHGLVLQEQKKRLISSLLERQDGQQNDGFDDLIRGKGKGLIFLLHGPPGVGKTYTAARWNAILSLDEADVYMQDRAQHNVQANQLVSILLRMAEYCEGILFLTTNREHTIDPTFRSRIHLSIAYPPLSVDARRQLWNAFIIQANRGQTPDWLSTGFLKRLAEEDINGREIRNVVRVGYSFARNARRDMKIDDLLQGIYALKQCENDLHQFSELEEAQERTDMTD